MAGPRIEIEIKGSEVKIDAIGFTGSACELETREVEEALGVVLEREKKPEFYTKATQKQSISNR